MGTEPEHIIVKLGHATRFAVGGRNCPMAAQRRASPPWAIRRAVQRIARAEFDVSGGVEGEIPLPTRADLCRALVGPRRNLTGIEVMAVELWIAALHGNIAAMQRLVRLVDGPPVRANRDP